MLHQESVAQNHKVMIVNKFFGNVAKLKYLGMTLTNDNYIHEEIPTTIWSRIFVFMFAIKKRKD
jgi:hypothetical protein